MIKELSIRLLPRQAASESSIKDFVCREYALNPHEVEAVSVLKRSIDARKRQVMVNLTIRIYINEKPAEGLFRPIQYPDVADRPEAIVVGAVRQDFLLRYGSSSWVCAQSYWNGDRTSTSAVKILPASVANTSSTTSRTTVLARAEPVPFPTGNSIPAARREAR